jgi:predicted dehydrogenase
MSSVSDVAGSDVGAGDNKGEPLRVAVIGVGGITQMMHLPTLTERPDLFDVRAVCDRDERTVNEVGARWSVERRLTSADDVLRLDDVQAVLLCAGGSQSRAVEDALAAGKHVFVEKPLGYCPSQVERAAAAARERDLIVQVGTHKRYDPAVVVAKQRVDAMRDLNFVGVRVLHPDDGLYRAHHAIVPRRGPAPPATGDEARRGMLDATRTQHEDAIDELVGADASDEHRVAGLVLFQSLLHDANLVRGMLGEPDEVLSAHVWNGGLSQTSLTRFGDARVELTWLFVPELKHYEEEVRFVAPAERLALTFPSPYLRHQPTSLRVERQAQGELVREEHTVGYEEAFRVELHAFVASVREGTTPQTGVDDALGDARWLNQIAQAFTRRT